VPDVPYDDIIASLENQGLSEEEINKVLTALRDMEKNRETRPTDDELDEEENDEDKDRDEDGEPDEEGKPEKLAENKKPKNPMKPVPSPEPPNSQRYEPEHGMEEFAPECVEIFNPRLGRDKRGKTFDRCDHKGKDGYALDFQNQGLERFEISDAPPRDAVRYAANMEIKVDSVNFTFLYLPASDVVITDFKVLDGPENIELYIDSVDNIRARLTRGGPARVRLAFNAWTPRTRSNRPLYRDVSQLRGSDTLLDAYYAGIDIGYDFKRATTHEVREVAADIMEVIDPDYFGAYIKMLRKYAFPPDDAVKDIRSRLRFAAVLHKLYSFCRTFGCDDIPDGDMLLEAAKNRRGVCRHRALIVFCICAAIGVPIRYVTNDCHAFVEVFIPSDKRWAGFDLGGCGGDEVGVEQRKKSRDELFVEWLMIELGLTRDDPLLYDLAAAGRIRMGEKAGIREVRTWFEDEDDGIGGEEDESEQE